MKLNKEGMFILFDFKMVKMLSYLLVYTMSLILISTDIKMYEIQEVTGALIKNSGFTGCFYQDLALDSI